jgi:hypothetical protein
MLLTLLVALGLVATTCVDVAVAQQRREHDRKVAAARAERRAERAFLRQVQPLAEAAYRSAAPVNVVLAALYDPQPGDVLAARDALAHGRALAGLRDATARIKALRVPAPLRGKVHDLTVALDTMASDLGDLGSHGAETSVDGLADAFNGDSAVGFGVAEGDFINALVAAFGRQHLTPPFTSDTDGPKPGPTPTSWIFGADRGCIAASLSLVDVNRYAKQDSLAALKTYVRLWDRALNGLAKRMATLPPPTGSAALPASVRHRLAVLRANAAFRAQVAVTPPPFAEADLSPAQPPMIRPQLRAP